MNCSECHFLSLLLIVLIVHCRRCCQNFPLSDIAHCCQLSLCQFNDVVKCFVNGCANFTLSNVAIVHRYQFYDVVKCDCQSQSPLHRPLRCTPQRSALCQLGDCVNRCQFYDVVKYCDCQSLSILRQCQM